MVTYLMKCPHCIKKFILDVSIIPERIEKNEDCVVIVFCPNCLRVIMRDISVKEAIHKIVSSNYFIDYYKINFKPKNNK